MSAQASALISSTQTIKQMWMHVPVQKTGIMHNKTYFFTATIEVHLLSHSNCLLVVQFLYGLVDEKSAVSSTFPQSPFQLFPLFLMAEPSCYDPSSGSPFLHFNSHVILILLVILFYVHRLLVWSIGNHLQATWHHNPGDKNLQIPNCKVSWRWMFCWSRIHHFPNKHT